MNFSQLLLEFLKKHGSVSVPGFGIFYLKNTNAIVDQLGKSILPPGKEVAFRNDSGDKGQDFIQFISTQKNISELEAEIEIRKQVSFWNSTLEKEGKLSLENLGTFFLDDSKIHFTGNRTENLSPDFYGLEEINISEIKNTKTRTANNTDKKPYMISKSIYWVLPLVIGVLALTYFGITQPEKIFGRKSLNDDFKKKPVGKIDKINLKKDSLKKDSAVINAKIDSVRNDSIKSVINSQKTPVKKWSSKKYSNSKWKKAKKPQNR
ncbi:hypothetical protein [Kaistella jeonii]|uniref:hypothetical protein n=1 Tax=Kaistella jeonii TaxID=266749 RepID=UPI0006922AEC|nr:hypothetical protein [Kaistella jeonii]SFC03839.1 hypothetical protein SAMN05421876_105158 [Kaistella jeonii]VEI96689.1 Uncharacterised protein [Kaistella jeonii]